MDIINRVMRGRARWEGGAYSVFNQNHNNPTQLGSSILNWKRITSLGAQTTKTTTKTKTFNAEDIKKARKIKR